MSAAVELQSGASVRPPTDVPNGAAVTGYVEATTAATVLGWAWKPSHEAPLTIELQLGGETVSETVADQLRDDLARSGIGTGRHAFVLPVPEAYCDRLSELRVVARTPDGAAVPLGAPPKEDGVVEVLTRLQRGMEMLVGSQRVLHRNLQAALLTRPEPDKAASSGSARVEEEIATLELFVVRLEHALAASQTPAAPQASGTRWLLGTVAGMAGVALLLSAWSLMHVLPGLSR